MYEGVGESVIEELNRRGHKLRISKSGSVGDPSMIYIDPETGINYGAGRFTMSVE